jgi:hypothetical protein
MWRARAYTMDSRDVGFTVTGRTERDASTMTHTGGPGPQVRERRPKTRRRCLGCDRMILTTCASRLCRHCLLRAADLRGGVDEMHLLGALTQTERRAVDPIL